MLLLDDAGAASAEFTLAAVSRCSFSMPHLLLFRRHVGIVQQREQLLPFGKKHREHLGLLISGEFHLLVERGSVPSANFTESAGDEADKDRS